MGTDSNEHTRSGTGFHRDHRNAIGKHREAVLERLGVKELPAWHRDRADLHADFGLRIDDEVSFRACGYKHKLGFALEA